MLLALCGLLAGCTAETPPASTPAAPTTTQLDDGTPVRLDPATRELTVGDETRLAGFGPTHVAVGAGGRVYVTDTGGGSVLLFRTEPHLKLWRRAALPGRPYGTALDRERGRLWVATTDTDELVRVTADGAPRIRGRFPTVRDPEAVSVDEGTGDVTVAAKGGTIRRLHSPGE